MSKFLRILKGIASKDYVPDTYTPADVYPTTWQGSWVEAAQVRLDLAAWYKATPVNRRTEQELIHVEVKR